MDNLFKLQQESQEMLDAQKPMNVGELCNNIRDMAFFMNQEVVELIEEIAGDRDINKPWKTTHANLFIQPIVLDDKVKSEAIDMLKFAMNICLMAGITPENVDEEFTKVHTKVLNRILDGY